MIERPPMLSVTRIAVAGSIHAHDTRLPCCGVMVVSHVKQTIMSASSMVCRRRRIPGMMPRRRVIIQQRFDVVQHERLWHPVSRRLRRPSRERRTFVVVPCFTDPVPPQCFLSRCLCTSPEWSFVCGNPRLSRFDGINRNRHTQSLYGSNSPAPAIATPMGRRAFIT